MQVIKEYRLFFHWPKIRISKASQVQSDRKKALEIVIFQRSTVVRRPTYGESSRISAKSNCQKLQSLGYIVGAESMSLSSYLDKKFERSSRDARKPI